MTSLEGLDFLYGDILVLGPGLNPEAHAWPGLAGRGLGPAWPWRPPPPQVDRSTIKIKNSLVGLAPALINEIIKNSLY